MVAWLFPAASSAAAADAPVPAVQGPVGLVGLIAGEDAALCEELTGAAHRALMKGGRVEVLQPGEVIRRLGRTDVGAADGADLERLRGLFQQGYLQSYSFEYTKAIETLERVLEGLQGLPHSPERWDLFVRSHLFLGIARAGLKDQEAALRAFAVVLRTRPGMRLTRKEYAPRIIRLFEKARDRLESVPRSKLVVETEPSGAAVFLDGVRVGESPHITRLPQGRYHLRVEHEETGDASRWIQIGESTARVRFQLSFEGALELRRAHPLIRLPAGEPDLPLHWWAWLGARLGIRHLIAVQLEDEGKRFHAALVDLERGRKIRAGWLELAQRADGIRAREACDLMTFLVTGQAADGLRVAAVPEPGAEAGAGPGPDGPLVPSLPVRHAPRPWFRKWWPYTLAAAALLAGGVASHLVAMDYRDQADEALTMNDIRFNQDRADLWTGLAVTGYALAGAAVVTGIVLDATYEPTEIEQGQARLVPLAGRGTLGAVLRFGF